MGRIKLAPPVPTNDNVLDRVQRRLGDGIDAVIRSPVLDSQIVVVPMINTLFGQQLVFSHQLGRPTVGIVVVSCTVLLIAFGMQRALSTTQSQIVLATKNPTDGATVTLLVF